MSGDGCHGAGKQQRLHLNLGTLLQVLLFHSSCKNAHRQLHIQGPVDLMMCVGLGDLLPLCSPGGGALMDQGRGRDRGSNLGGELGFGGSSKEVCLFE